MEVSLNLRSILDWYLNRRWFAFILRVFVAMSFGNSKRSYKNSLGILNSSSRWGKNESLEKLIVFSVLGEGCVDEGLKDEGFIMASISGMILSLPFICFVEKEYFENHFESLNNCALGICFFLKLSM